MGQVKHVVVDSSTHLLQLLGVSGFALFQDEFRHVLRDVEVMPYEENWSTEPELLEVLYCYIRATRPHTVVEIGTYKGLSAIILATGLERNKYGHLFTVDNNESKVLAEAEERFSKEPLNHRITLIKKSSQDAFVDWGRARIDFLYIDGSHSFLDACCDFALWSRYLTHSGIIVIHDTVTRLLRRFPEDYIYPLCCYDVLNVTDVQLRPSGQEWEGCGFVTEAVENTGG
jgi:predicted O-methyltransferase YrrM